MAITIGQSGTDVVSLVGQAAHVAILITIGQSGTAVVR